MLPECLSVDHTSVFHLQMKQQFGTGNVQSPFSEIWLTFPFQLANQTDSIKYNSLYLVHSTL